MKNSKKLNKTKQKKYEEIRYRYLIASMVIGLLYYMFIESQYIGGDKRYDFFIFWIPVLIGLILIIKFNFLSVQWNEIFPTLRNEKNVFLKIIYIPILFLKHFIISVIFFWIPSNIVWDCVNKIESYKSPIETYVLTVYDFHSSSGRTGSNKIRFKFKDETESIKTSYKDIEHYLKKNPEDFQVIIEVKKGIWNHYILESWEIKEGVNH